MSSVFTIGTAFLRYVQRFYDQYSVFTIRTAFLRSMQRFTIGAAFLRSVQRVAIVMQGVNLVFVGGSLVFVGGSLVFVGGSLVFGAGIQYWRFSEKMGTSIYAKTTKFILPGQRKTPYSMTATFLFRTTKTDHLQDCKTGCAQITIHCSETSTISSKTTKSGQHRFRPKILTRTTFGRLMANFTKFVEKKIFNLSLSNNQKSKCMCECALYFELQHIVT